MKNKLIATLKSAAKEVASDVSEATAHVFISTTVVVLFAAVTSSSLGVCEVKIHPELDISCEINQKEPDNEV